MRRWLAIGLLLMLAPPLSAQQTGSLILATEPAAEVFWQGVSLGLTDDQGLLQIAGIPAGTYAILLVKPGFLAESTVLRIVPGEQRRQMSLTPLADPSLPELQIPDPAAFMEPAETPPQPGGATPGTPDTDPVAQAAEPAIVPADDSSAELPEVSPATDQAAIRTSLSEAAAARRANPENSPRAGSRFERPAVVPGPADTESDLRIVVWWALALIAAAGSIHLLRRRYREDQALEEGVADFTRALSPRKGDDPKDEPKKEVAT